MHQPQGGERQAEHAMLSTLVRMSVCGVLDARSWTLMARCTMGMSRSLMLNTTISAWAAGALCTEGS